MNLIANPPTPCRIGKRPPAPEKSAGHKGVAGGGYKTTLAGSPLGPAIPLAFLSTRRTRKRIPISPVGLFQRARLERDAAAAHGRDVRGREALAEGAVVRNDDQRAVVRVERASERVDRVDVEVVARLVENQHVARRQREDRERDSRLLAAAEISDLRAAACSACSAPRERRQRWWRRRVVSGDLGERVTGS